MKKIVLFILLFASFGFAQLPSIPSKGNVYFGYSYGHFVAKSMNGWSGSLEGHVLPFMSLVADFNGNYASDHSTLSGGGTAIDTQTENRVHTFLFGPRAHMQAGRLRPFAHVLVGVARYHYNFDHVLTNNGVQVPEGTYHFSVTNNRFIVALGGGSDLRVAKVLDWRVQADYVRVAPWQSDGSNNARLSTGLVFRF